MALKGIQVLEIAGLAPAPFCGMILADFGAKVIRIDKAPGTDFEDNFVSHGKLSVGLNLKHPDGVEVFKKLTKTSDVIIEPFRAGVMEKLGLGPKTLLQLNKGLIYARLSGYGQEGSLSQKAGHDINFLSYSGVLSMLGPHNSGPLPPSNLLADFGGGGLICALGILLALYDKSKHGLGQVVDCSMTRGAAYLASWLFRSHHSPLWGQSRGQNMLDGGCYFYKTYKTKDDKWMAVGALEKKFYDNLLIGLRLSAEEVPQFSEFDSANKIISDRFKMHSQAHWINVFKDLDACVSPVLSIDEAAKLDHNVMQNSFVKSCDVNAPVPSPEPRLSLTPSHSRSSQSRPPIVGEHTLNELKILGYSEDEIHALAKRNAVFFAYGNSKL
uniref:Putative l-carnitine dehydratase/alpha-methylacyl-coa racemase n=1 Tax=Triatoma infestans TaxID=30076 RepID=A0A023F110_TRIIF